MAACTGTASAADDVQSSADVARRMGSTAADIVLFIADLGEELPVLCPALKTIKTIREYVEATEGNKGDVKMLADRCSYLVAGIIVKCRRDSSDINVNRLAEWMGKVEAFVRRYSKLGKVLKFWRAKDLRQEMCDLNKGITDLASDAGLAGIVVVEEKLDAIDNRLATLMDHPENVFFDRVQPAVTQARVPKDTPMLQAWHVSRSRVVQDVCKALAGNDVGEPMLVGLVGDSGSGKTTAASDLARCAELRTAFSDGILWLTIDGEAKGRLPSLMLQLATKVHEEVCGYNGDGPIDADVDHAEYIKRWTKGTGRRCLVIADDVRDAEVVTELRKTGLWILVTTQRRNLVTDAGGVTVGIDKLSPDDASSILSKASELPYGVTLPEAARDVPPQCGNVAMLVAFVGRWGAVRKRDDSDAWSESVADIRAELTALNIGAPNETLKEARAKRRLAVLRVGFKYLAAEDCRVQELYLGLAVMPDKFTFNVADATVLLFGKNVTDKNLQTTKEVLNNLERWSIVTKASGGYQTPDAHAMLARENLKTRPDVHQLVIKRWATHLSSDETVRSTGTARLVRLGCALKLMGGNAFDVPPLAFWKRCGSHFADTAKPCLQRKRLEVAAWICEGEGDWAGAMALWERLLGIEVSTSGREPFVVNTMRWISKCATRVGHVQAAEKWRRKERELLERYVDISPLGKCVGTASLFSLAFTSVPFSRYCNSPSSRAGTEGGLRSRQRGDCQQHVEPRQYEEVDETVKGSAQAIHVLGMLAGKAMYRGGTDGALPYFREILRCVTVELGPDSLQAGEAMRELATCILGTEGAVDKHEAIELYEKALEIEAATLGADHVHFAKHVRKLWTLLCPKNQLRDDNVNLLTLFMTWLLRRPASHDVDLADEFVHIARCLRIGERTRRLAQASDEMMKLDPLDVVALNPWVRAAPWAALSIELLTRALEVYEATLGGNHVKVARALYEVGVHALNEGENGKAAGLFERALEIEEVSPDVNDVRLAKTRRRLEGCLDDSTRSE